MDKEKLADKFSKKIKEITPSREVRAIHICGTHEQAITQYGLRSLLPDNFDLTMGPGCPVCVTPAREVDEAIELAKQGVTIATFGDMLNVPGSEESLSDARSEGADVRVVYSINEALKIAKDVEELVFFGIGFETTAPTNAAILKSNPPENFYILSSHRLIPPAMELLVDMDVNFDGFIAPGHVSTIIGKEPYEVFANKYDVPTIITGFEPLDILFGVLKFFEQIDSGETKVENAYERAVRDKGNQKAQKMMTEVFEVFDAKWRGIGEIPNSGLKLSDEFREFDARENFEIELGESRDIHPGCKCHLILTARGTPEDCGLFGDECTPQDPHGPCMVSDEGECNIWFRYGRRPKMDI
ncbi:hydrogenase formation protein HypD [archaeon SCG-AAA382B04]|nr:hydrogenase formation protein HypD [archaeon SCG-AAA382B04]